LSVKTARIICSIIIATVIFVPVVFFGTGFFASASQRVLPGVGVLGVDMTGCSRSEGIQRLTELEKNLRATRVVLRFQDRRWPLLLGEAGLDLDEEAIMDGALGVGRQGSLLRRWQERRDLKEKGLSLEPVIGLDRPRLTQRVKELTREISVEPRDATFKINSDDTVGIVPASDGVSVDIERLERDIHAFILDAKRPEIALFLAPVKAGRSTEDVESMGVNGLLAGYTTWFDPSKVSRAYNVSVAARAFDELLVAPGEEVSFNKVVGPRSSEAGYRNAPVIINNEFVEGIGGGVCQVSTTLYNSVLLANLEIVERTNHSLPVSYVPIGRDATVVYESIDFKFRNNTGNYLFIKSYVHGGYITFKIFGNTVYKRDVVINSWVVKEIEPKTVYENDPTLPKGEQVVKQEGSKGFKAFAERVVMLNGSVERREMLPASDYSPVNKVVAVGTAEKPAPKPSPSTQTQGAGQQIKPGSTGPDIPAADPGLSPQSGGGVTNRPQGGGAGLAGADSSRSVAESNTSAGGGAVAGSDNQNQSSPFSEDTGP